MVTLVISCFANGLAMTTFNTKILDHFYHPRGAGKLDERDQSVQTSRITTPDGTTVMQLQLQLEGELIKQACFQTLGCPACIAVTSVICEYLQQHPYWRALKDLTSDYLIEILQLPPATHYCAWLGKDLIQKLRSQSFE